ncbi:MAG: hypothetical protein WAU81_02765 [Candidatus Aminicenantales bacterium]
MKRGTYEFEVMPNGNLADSPENLERARKLFLDGAIINGLWGPGNPGDFDYGGWHCLCHLVAAGGVYKGDEGYVCVAITHAGNMDKYLFTLSVPKSGGAIKTIGIQSAEGQDLLKKAVLLGYVEGTSEGHISARGVQDPRDAFNGWPRQDFDQSVDSDEDGGTVWEHWSTTRDLRESSSIGDSVLRAYLSMVSLMGGEFVATVVRGRRTYEHPTQLCAMIKAGFISRDEALRDMKPHKIPPDAERHFKEANPTGWLEGIATLKWPSPPERRYYMFKRRIKSWSKAKDAKSDLKKFGL